MDQRLLEILCCPVTRTPLRLLGENEIARVNTALGNQEVLNGAGTRVVAPLVAGLITRDGRSIYRIDDDIPVMLADEAIAVAQLDGFEHSSRHSSGLERDTRHTSP